MRTAISTIVACAVLAPAAASALPSRFAAGGDVGLLMHAEGSGHRTVLLSLQPRTTLRLIEHLDLSAVYSVALAFDGSVLRAATQYHRLTVGPEAWWQIRAARFLVTAGPALNVVHTSFSDRNTEAISTTYARLGVAAGLSLEVPLPPAAVRVGMETLWWSGRTDLVFSLGATFDVGGGVS